jgi:protein-S-isoprenylcysteine O-methyltransferase Ste14
LPGKEIRSVLRIISLAGLLTMALALAGLVIRGVFFSSQPLAIIAEIAAAALMMWARVTFGRRSFHGAANPTAGGLVTTGPYRFIRHPIYAAVCLFAWAGILSQVSAVNILLGILLFVGIVARILCEERLIVDIYPEYRDYALGTKRLVPYIF